MEPGKIELVKEMELVKQHTPFWVYVIIALILSHILIFVLRITNIETQFTYIQNQIDTYKLPTHNGVITVAFGKRTNMFTVLPDGRMYLLIPLPVTTESGMVEVVEELHGEGVEKKVKVQK